MSDIPTAAWRALLLFGFLALFTVALLAIAYSGKGPMRSVGYATSTAPMQIVIGNDVFNVPENMIRHPHQRRQGLAERLDLTVLWPSGEGYTEASLAAFANTDPRSVDTVIIGIAKRQSLLDMSMRYHPVLKKALVPNSLTRAEDGLVEAQLAPQYGFINESLIVSQARRAGGDPTFVARCHTPHATAETLLHGCETDIFIGTSSVATIRFARHQLQNWQQFAGWLDALIQHKLMVSES